MAKKWQNSEFVAKFARFDERKKWHFRREYPLEPTDVPQVVHITFESLSSLTKYCQTDPVVCQLYSYFNSFQSNSVLITVNKLPI